MNEPTNLVQIFCKAPRVGEVKTRLIPGLEPGGAEKAATLYEAMVERVVTGLRNLPGTATVIHMPVQDESYFLRFKLPLYTQQGSNLGQKMCHALRSGLEDYDRVVLLGTDCPLIDAEYIEHAFQALDDHDVVLGPAEDGGYGLVGVSQRVPEMFDDIDWGTDVVLSQTCRKLNQLRINYALLPLVWDVDRPGDLPRYQAWLAGLKS